MPREVYYQQVITDPERKLRETERFRLLHEYGNYIAKFLGDLRGISKEPIKGYQDKFDRPELATDASLYWSDGHQQLVIEERDEGSERATVKSLISACAVFQSALPLRTPLGPTLR